jgi:hypothetical protein
VEHRAHAVLVQHAQQLGVVGDVELDEVAALLDAVGAEARVGRDVAARGDHPRALRQQALREPGADEALRAGDEHRNAVPAPAQAIPARCIAAE